MTNQPLDVCEILPWDTAFFGFRIARILESQLTASRAWQVDAWCRRNRVRCLYFLACSDDSGTTILAEDHGFRLVDIRVTLARETQNLPTASTACPGPELRVRAVRRGDLEALQSIAGESYQHSRFYYDTSFPRSLSKALYETWIRRSCEGYARIVHVVESGSAIAGFVTCHVDEQHDTGSIGLVGVSRRMRGEGIGKVLVLEALKWFASQDIGQVSVVTQGRNIAAQRLYQRLGFLTQTVELWYHKWYDLLENEHD